MTKRTLESLQKQYAREVAPQKGGMRGPGPGGPRRGMQRASGKPKNTKQTISRLMGYIAQYKFLLILVFFFMILNTVASLCGSYMLSPIINRIQLAVAPDSDIKWTSIGKAADSLIEKITSTDLVQGIFARGTAEEITVYVFCAILVLAVVYLTGILSTYIQARIMLHVSQSATEKIRNDLFNKLQNLPVRFFDSNTTGEIMSRFTNDIDNIDMMLNHTLTQITSGIITLLGTFTFMVTTNIWLTLITVAFIPIFAKGGAIIASKSGKHYKSKQKALGAVNGYIEESVTGQKVVKVFNHENVCIEEFGMLNDDLRDKEFKAQFYGGIMGPIMGNTSQISYAVTLGVGGIMMAYGGFGAGDLTVFANYSKQFSMPINMISQQMSTIFSALAGAERVFSIMDTDAEVDEATTDENVIIKGDVVVEDITFGYVPEKTILKNVSLYAHPGQKIAFVGSTGAGKTTITNLINRFYDVDKGRILVDGKDICSYSKGTLRKNIAMVLQDTHLFTGTVRENIRYGRLDATDEEVIEAAKTASAHSFIMRLENGYDTVLDGDGANLSQGQRQLLNIARAAISKAPILILDEATSSVDTRTERHIERGMDRLMKDRTTFVIAHRLSTVRNATAIMVLEAGEIIERGNHDELIAQKGRYYELYTGKKELD